jgi:hypothetical protein
MAGIFQQIDRLTNSIVNRFSGDSFSTEVLELGKKDLSNLKRGWKFDWLTNSFLKSIKSQINQRNENVHR